MRIRIFMLVLAGLVFFGLSNNLYAHCDTLNGPVVKDARIALEKGDLKPVLKWLRAKDEKEVQAVFQKTLVVRTKGPKAKELADMYFFETLVRIHRAGEGAPYTGLKPGDTVDPAVALADKALESGSVEKLVNILTKAMANGIRLRFKHAGETKKHANDSVIAGREFVKAYVLFTHYVEGMHTIIKGGGGHHKEGTKGHSEHGK